MSLPLILALLALLAPLLWLASRFATWRAMARAYPGSRIWPIAPIVYGTVVLRGRWGETAFAPSEMTMEVGGEGIRLVLTGNVARRLLPPVLVPWSALRVVAPTMRDELRLEVARRDGSPWALGVYGPAATEIRSVMPAQRGVPRATA